MRKFKLLSLSLLLIGSLVLFESCSDLCEGVACEYDGECTDGDCVCVDLTENFLIGSWELLNSGDKIGTFNKDNTYIDSFGNVVNWELDSLTNTILISTGNKIVVSEDGFSCNQMNVTIENGSSVKDFVFTRQ